MKSSFIYLRLLFCCCLFPAVISAVEPAWYEVEVIVFEQSTQTRLESETWNQQISLPEVSNSIDFLSPDPARVALEQLCLQGKIVPVLAMIPVTEVVEEIEETEPADVVITHFETMDSKVQDNEEQEQELPFVILDKNLNQLNDLRSSLARRKGYRPLLHVSWRQPVESRKNSQLIRLYSGDNFSDTFKPEGDSRVDIAMISTEDNDIDAIINPVDSNTQLNFSKQKSQLEEATEQESFFQQNHSNVLPFDNNSLMTEADYRHLMRQQLTECQNIYQQQLANQYPDVWQFDGNIRIYVKRYLHLETDLILRIPGKKELQLGAIETSLAADKLLDSIQSDSLHQNDNNETGFGWKLDDNFLSDNQSQSTVILEVLNKYKMQQNRRIRSNEIHYIDHPLFGLLIQIRPYEKDTEEDDIQTTS